MNPRRTDKSNSYGSPHSHDSNFEKATSEQKGKNVPKIHRATVLLNSISSIYRRKVQEVFYRITNKAKRAKIKDIKMVTVLHSVFRRFGNSCKFDFLHSLKKNVIAQRKAEIETNDKIISSMNKSVAKILALFLKNKRIERLSDSFFQMKTFAQRTFLQRNRIFRKGLRSMIAPFNQKLKFAFNKLRFTQLKLNKRYALKKIVDLLKKKRHQRISNTIWRLRKNVMSQRHKQILDDIKIFEQKIQNTEDPEITALREKRQKLEDHMKKIQHEQEELQENLEHQVEEMNKKKQNMGKKIQELTKQNLELEQKIQKLEEQRRKPYSLDEIFQCLYNNMLLYLHENKDQLYNKEEVLNSLKTPLIPIDVPIEKIKQENEAMQELINQYIVMFGDRRSELKGQEFSMPYEYLVKQNYSMYKMLQSLLPLAQNDKQGLTTIKDSIFKLECKVKELWGK